MRGSSPKIALCVIRWSIRLPYDEQSLLILQGSRVMNQQKKQKNGKKQGVQPAKPKVSVQPQGGQQKQRNQVENFYRLGPCAKKFAASLRDPFEGPADACLPVSPAYNSRKIKIFTRGVMAAGTNGFGYIVMANNPANDGAAATPASAVYYSLTTYAGSTVSTNSVTTGVSATNSNSDYTTAALTAAGVGSRMVSMGVRIRYKGTELNRGGRILSLEEPDHGTLNGASATTFLAYEKCHQHAVLSSEKDWVTVCHTGPVSPAEYDFLSYSSAAAYPSFNTYYLGLLVESTASNLFDFECYWNYEIIGPTIRGKVFNESDDVGTQVVLATVRGSNGGALDSKSPFKSPLMIEQGAIQYANHNISGFFARSAGVAGDFLLAAPNPYAKAAGGALKLLQEGITRFSS